MALSKSYLANLGKSLYYSAKTAVKQEMPILAGTYEKNKEIYSSGVQYVKNFTATKGATSSGGVNTMVSQFLKDLDEMKRNAFEDLRSGKLNNFDREYEKLERKFSDFGGGEGGDFNLNFDDSDAEFSFVEDERSISIRQTKISEAGSNMRTKALIDTMIDSSERSANYIVSNNRKLSSMFMTMSAQMHTEMIKTVTDTNNLLTSIVEFHNNQLLDHMNKTLTFYDNVLQELREIKEGLIPKKEEPSSKPLGFEDVIGSSGIDLKAYGQIIKRNFSTWFGGTSLGMAMSMTKMVSNLGGGGGSPLSALKNNPLGFITDLMVSGLMPKSLKFAMQNLDKSIVGLFSSMILGLNKLKGDFSSPLNQFIGSIFGIDVSGRKTVDPSKFHKGVVQYNGKADKAITEVIPTLLSHILSAVKGDNKVLLYNYNTGRFMQAGSLIKENESRIRRSGVMEMYDIRDNMKNRLAQVKGGTSEFMIEELDTFLDYLITSGSNYNPYKAKTAKDLSGLKLNDERSYTLLRAAFMSMPKSLQNRIAHGIVKGRMGASRTTELIEKELQESGLGIAYAGLEPPSVKSKGYSITNSLLRDIKNILIEGIRVVQIGAVPAKPALITKIMGRKIDASKVTDSSSISGHPNISSASNLQGKKDLEDSYNQSEEQLLKKMAVAENMGSRDSSFRKFVEGVTSQSSVRDKFRVIRQSLSPMNILSKGVNKIDEFIHTLIFGSRGKEPSDSGDDDGDGGPSSKGFFSRMTQRISLAIDKSIKWVDKHILTPLHEKFFGENGIFTKFQEKITPFLDKFKEFAKSRFEKMKEFFLGSVNKEGFYTGGIFADIGNSFKDYSNQLRHFFTGAGYTKSNGEVVAENKETSVFAYVKKYSRNIMEGIKTGLFGTKYETDEVDPETGEVKKVTKRNKDGLLSGIMDQLKKAYKVFDGLFKSKKGESDEDVENSINQWKRELKGFLPKGLAGGLLGMLSSAVLPGGPLLWGFMGSTIAFASHSKKFREFLFGNDQEGRPGIIPPHYKKILGEVKRTLPSILGGGAVGLGASLLLPGGPVLGITLGSALGFAAKSKTMQEWLFGKTDEKGNVITKGVLGPEFKEKMEEYLPSIGAGGVLGMGASLFLPGGALLGLTLGSAIGFASKSKKVQEMLFGKTDEKGNIITKGLISPSMRKKIQENLPKGIAGAIFGSLSGLVTGGILPGGPLVGAMVGASMSILSSSDKFKEFMFGKVDPESGKRVGGLLGSVRDFVRDEFLIPFKGWVKSKGKVIGEWFDKAIKEPLFNAMQPLKAAFGILGKNIKNAWDDLKNAFVKTFHEVFTKNVGIPLKNFIKENITDPLKNMLNKFFNFLGKGLSMIITAPIKGLTLFANSIVDSEAKATGMSREEVIEKYGGKEDDHPVKPETGSKIIEQTKETLAKANIAGLLPAATGPAGLLPEPQKKETFVDRLNKDIQSGKYGKDVQQHGFLQLFGDASAPSNKGRLKLNLGNVGGEDSLLHRIFGVLVSFGKKIKNIDESTQGMNAQLKEGIIVKERHHGDGRPLNIMGDFDFDRFTAHNTTMLQYVRDIRNEVTGQLDGVGYNIETIKNILVDSLGEPSVEATGMKTTRGNRKRRGLLGRLMDIIKSPFTFMKNMIKTIVLKPIRRLWSFTWNLIGKIPNVLKNVVVGAGKTIGKIVRIPFRILTSTISGIGKFLRSDFVKSLGKFASTVINSVLIKPLKGITRVVSDMAKGTWEILKGFGGLVKDSVVGLFNLSRKVIPALTKGMINLTTTVGKAVIGMAKFVGGLIGKGFRAVGRMFGIGKMRRIQGDLTGLSGNPVYVVGGTLDRVEKIDKVDILTKIEECVKMTSCSGDDNTNPMKARRKLRLNLQNFASDSTEDSGSEHSSKTAGKKTFKRPSMFSKIGSFISKMGKGKWNSAIPRIMAIENLTKNVRSEQEYHNATLGLLNELVVSNIQILEATNNNTEKSKSLFDWLKDALNFVLPGLSSLLNDLFNGGLIGRLLGRPFVGGPGGGSTGGGRPPVGGGGGGSIFTGGGGGGSIFTSGGGGRPPILIPPSGGGTPTIFLPPRGGFKGSGGGGPVALPPMGGTGPSRTLALPGSVQSPHQDPYIDMTKGKDGKYYYSGSNNTSAYKGFASEDFGPYQKVPKSAQYDVELGKDGVYRVKPTGAGKFKNLLKGTKKIPYIGTIAGLGLIGYDAYNMYAAESQYDKEQARGNLFGTLGGIAGGAAAGAALGAVGGSVVPGIGNIVGGVIGGIGGAIIGEAGVKRIYEKRKDISEWAKNSYNKVKNFTTDSISAFWNSAPVETVRNLTSGFITMISEIGTGVLDAGGQILGSVGRLFGRMWDSFKETVQEKWNKHVVEPFKSHMEQIKENWNKFKDWTRENWNKYAVEPFKSSMEWIKESWGKVKDWAGENWNNWVIDPLNTFGNIIKDKWTEAKDWLSEKWDTYVPEPVKIFFNNIKDRFDEAKKWVSDKWESLVTNPLKNLGSSIKNFLDKASDWAGDLIDSVFKDRGKKAKEAMIEAGKNIGEKARSVGSDISGWIDSLWQKGGGDPSYDDLTYAITGSIPGTDATASDLRMIKNIADKFGINPHLWLALAETESNLYSKASNPSSSARGWGQLVEGTARGIYENTLKLGKYNHDLAFDKNLNATMSMAYLRQMFDTFDGDATKAIIAYNVGPGNVKKGIGLTDTGGYGPGHGIEYLQKVVKNLKENTGLDIKDVVDPSKMTPVDFTAIGASLGGYNAGMSGSMKEYTLASTLGSLGAYLSGEKMKELYGFDPSELMMNLDSELLKQTDPFYAAFADSSGSTYNAANKVYSNADIETIKSRNASLYPLVSGDNDIHEFFAERLNNIARAYGKPLSINSGYRTDAEQMQLINEWKAKNPGKSEAERRKWVADPGRSNHAVGIAADISGWIQDLSEEELAKFGLYRPMSWEPWHFEPIETKIYGRTRDELMPLFGTPIEPNPNLASYISSEFKGSTSTMMTPSYGSIIAGQIGGGDPLYDTNRIGPPDISQYTQRVGEAVSINRSSANDGFDKMIELLGLIVTSLDKLVDISDESKGILKNYFQNVGKSSSTKTSNKPIVSSTNETPINPLSNNTSFNRKRNDKSSIIVQIAKGTTL